MLKYAAQVLVEYLPLVCHKSSRFRCVTHYELRIWLFSVVMIRKDVAICF